MKTIYFLLGLATLASCVPDKPAIERAEIDDRTAVEVLRVSSPPMVREGRYFGFLEPRSTAVISAEVGGKVLEIKVDEGSVVSPGDEMMRIDDEALVLAERLAEQGVASAKLRVAQMAANLEVQKKTLQAQVEQAEAMVVISKARLSSTEKGARYEEKQQFAAALEVAKVARENGKLELDRVKALLEANAATQQQYDGALANYESAKARYNQSLQAKRLVDVGARQEDKDSARAQLAQSEAALAAARAALESLVVQEKELEGAKLQAENAEINLENARLNRSKALVVSLFPTKGVVSERMVETGEMASPGKPLFRLLDMARQDLVLKVASVDVPYLKIGAEVEVHCIGDPTDGPRRGKVQFVSFEAHAQNTTFAVKVELENEDGALRAGQMCEARPKLGTLKLPVVPRDAVLDTPEGKVVMLEEGGKVRERTVVIEMERDGVAAISDGLADGDRVVVVGQRLVRDGDEVNVRAERSEIAADSSAAR